MAHKNDPVWRNNVRTNKWYRDYERSLNENAYYWTLLVGGSLFIVFFLVCVAVFAR